MKFYTLFYLRSDVSSSDSNFAENGFLRLRGYMRCCETLAASLRKQGYTLTLLTNAKKEIENNLAADLEVKGIDFCLDVPKGIKFFGAHYKIDAFKWIAENASDYSILIDNDVVCLNPAPEGLEELIKSGVPVYYDITDQVYPANSQERIIRDKSKIMGRNSFGLWAGGEFVGGPPEFFGRLYDECVALWPTYRADPDDFHHQSDEMVVSCAIEMLQNKGVRIIDAGKLGAITRYWSVKTLHAQRPIEAAYDNCLIHLPADKEYLSDLNHLQSIGFREDYAIYCRLRERRNKKQNWLYRTYRRMWNRIAAELKKRMVPNNR